MPGLVPGIHVFKNANWFKDVDGRDKPGHDEKQVAGRKRCFLRRPLPPLPDRPNPTDPGDAADLSTP